MIYKRQIVDTNSQKSNSFFGSFVTLCFVIISLYTFSSLILRAMSNVTAKEAGTVHGQNPQYLVFVVFCVYKI